MASSPSRDRVAQHRQKLREQGLRPVQFWLPDTRSEAFKAEARRQALAVAQSTSDADDQAFIDAITDDEQDAGK